MKTRKGWIVLLLAALLCIPSLVSQAATGPLVEVTALGFVDVDGAKIRAVALEYDQDMTGAQLSPDTYQLTLYEPEGFDEKGEGEIGDILAAYVNDRPEISENGGSGHGRYVILEVFTDYVASSAVAYSHAMQVKVDQVQAIETDAGTVPETAKTKTNHFGQRNKSLRFVIPDIQGFRYYTDKPGDYGADGPAYVREHCFSQVDGKEYDESLAYALWLPEDYHEDGTYAMVTLQNPAAAAGTHPMEAVLQTRSPAVYASEWAQQLVKETHGVDGLIVLVPVITERVDDNGCTPAEYEAVVHLWDEIIQTYHVDPNLVYGTGQSVGGMILLETNRNRDNFFAGLLLYEDQWAQNYYMDTIFARDMVLYEATAESAPRHYPRTDGYITWDYSLDTNGEKVCEGHDPNNYYYLVSDDSILITQYTGNNLSNDTWMEMSTLYEDLTGVQIPHRVIDAGESLEKQNAELEAYLSEDVQLGIHWISFDNGVNGYSSRKLSSTYAWLLKRTREEEIQREKLDINRPFALADEQILDDSRRIHFTELDGSPIYLLTAKAGAGTQGYNTCWLNLKTVADAKPGWLPEGMSWEKGVALSKIVSVTGIGRDAVAIEYNEDMTGLVVHLAGDPVVNDLTGVARENQTILHDPFEMYDAQGEKLDVSIRTVYVNDAAQIREGAQRREGEGRYVIVEFETPASAPCAGVRQRTTLRTDRFFAEASHEIRY